MSDPDVGGNSIEILRYRTVRNERRLDDLESWRRAVDTERATMREQMLGMREDINHLSRAFDSLRKTLLAFAITIAVASIGFALSVLAATGRI